MCFTVAILRKDVLLTTQQYYDNLALNVKGSDFPYFPDMYLVNGFTHPKLPIIKEDGIDMFDWGLIPSWIKNEADASEIRKKTLNAVGETIFDRPSFRENIKSNRCLLPVSGFYEWREFNGLKYPYFIQPNNDITFTLGAVYDCWIDKDTGEITNTFSIVTTVANALMEKIHNKKKRMPLIVSTEDSYKWLDSSINRQSIEALIKPYPEELMDAYTISTLANDVRKNRNVPEIMNQVLYPELKIWDFF